MHLVVSDNCIKPSVREYKSQLAKNYHIHEPSGLFHQHGVLKVARKIQWTMTKRIFIYNLRSRNLVYCSIKKQYWNKNQNNTCIQMTSNETLIYDILEYNTDSLMISTL